MCDPLATNWESIGVVTEDTLNSLLPSTFNTALGTVVNLTCYFSDKYDLQGPSQVTCVSGEWVPTPPTCVRKNRLPQADDNVDDILTELRDKNNSSNVDDILKDLRDKNDSYYYSIVLIIIACACALLLFIIVICLIYKFYCVSRHYRKGRRRLSEISMKTEDDRFEEMRDRPQWSGRNSFTRSSHVYSSRLSVHGRPVTAGVGRQHSIRSAPLPGGPGSQPDGGAGTTRTWDILSVDRLLRDIEYSRRHNPRHSWRDFATVSRTPSMLTQ